MSDNKQKVDRFLSPLLLVTFILCVLFILVVFPGVISVIICISAIITGVLAFIIIQRREVNSRINNLFVNEKKFLLVLFFVSIVCRIFFINTQKTSTDVTQDIDATKLILQKGIEWYFINYAQLRHVGLQYPPLYPLLLATIFPFGVELLYVKLFTVIVNSLTIIPTYFLGKEFYDKRKASLSALLLFALPYLFLMSLQGMNDVLITFFSALFMYFFIFYVNHGKRKHGILAGAIMGLGLLFKYTIGVFYLSTLLFAVIYGRKKENNALSKTLFVVFVSLLVLIPWISYMHYTGLIEAQIDKILSLSQLGRTSGSFSISKRFWWLLFFSESFVVLSPTNGVLLLLFIFHVVYRRKSDWKNSLLLLWVLVPFIIFGFLQPLIRYWMLSFPALTLLIANAIEDLNREQYRGKIFLITFVCSLIFCFLITYISLIYSSDYLVSHSLGELWDTYFKFQMNVHTSTARHTIAPCCASWNQHIPF